MFVTVGDLLRAIGGSAQVLAGAEGLDRCVRSAALWQGAEAPGQALLDDLAVVRAEQATAEVVREACRLGAAALAVIESAGREGREGQLGREGQAGRERKEIVSREALREADTLSMPIIALPAGFGEHRLAVLSLSENLRRHEALVQSVMQLHKVFMRSFDDLDFDAVAQLLSERLNRSVALVNRGDEILGRAACSEEDADQFEQVLESLPMATHVRSESMLARFGCGASERLDTIIRRVPVSGERNLVRYIPIAAHGHTAGAMVIWPGDPQLSSAEAVGLSIAATVGSLEILKDKAAREIERHTAYQLVEDLLAGAVDTRASLMRRADALGWSLEGAFSVLVLEADCEPAVVSALDVQERLAEELDRTVTTAKRLARDSGLYAIVVPRGKEVVVLLRQATGGSARAVRDMSLKFGKAVTAALNSRQSGIRMCVGIGQFRADLSKLSISYQEAKKALSIGRAIGARTSVIHFDDLGVYRVIAKCSDRSELEAFVRDKLGPLIDYDMRRGTCLVETLRVYFDSASSPASAAKTLFVHVNTVKQRLARISQIAGLDFSSTDDQFLAYMALKILDFLRA